MPGAGSWFVRFGSLGRGVGVGQMIVAAPIRPMSALLAEPIVQVPRVGRTRGDLKRPPTSVGRSVSMPAPPSVHR